MLTSLLGPWTLVVSVLQVRLLLRQEYAFANSPSSITELSDGNYSTARCKRDSSFANDTFFVAPSLISAYEANFYYDGICANPPRLIWRSDFESNPFRLPQRRERHFKPARKMVFRICNKYFRETWRALDLRLRFLFKAHGFRTSTLNHVSIVRFLTVDQEYGTETLSPITLWIAVGSDRPSAAAIRDVTPGMLQIFKEARFCEVVEWCEDNIAGL